MKENIIFQTRLHWILFFWPTVLMIAGIALCLSYHSILYVGYMILGVGFLSLLANVVSYTFSIFQVLPHSIRVRVGVLVRETVNIPYSKIEMINLKQSILGSVLNFGTIIIVGTGGTRNVINNIAKPLTCRRHIEQLVHANQH